jgi:hypothetical protein
MSTDHRTQAGIVPLPSCQILFHPGEEDLISVVLADLLHAAVKPLAKTSNLSFEFRLRKLRKDRKDQDDVQILSDHAVSE